MHYYLTLKNLLNWRSALTITLLLMLNWVNVATAATCQYDFSPCICTLIEADNTYDITCGSTSSGVPMAVVTAVFQSKPALNLKSLNLYVESEGDSIPTDLLGQSQFASAGELKIYGALPEQPLLIVDPNSFRLSKNSLGSIEFGNLDTNRMDFDFLIDFFSLTKLLFSNLVLNLEKSLPTLPSLPALKVLYFFGTSSDLNKAFTDTVLKCNGLTNLAIVGGPDRTDILLNDEGMSQLMDWVLPSSANTLELIQINFYITNITRTPLQLGSFKNLRLLTFQQNDNTNMVISAGSVFSNPDRPNPLVDFVLTNTVIVEEGAFQGNYAGSSILLNKNQLKRFEAGAFKSILEQMANSSSGSITVTENPFDCYTDPCHLAWITRDNRNLLNYLIGANCNGVGESFADMSPSYFTNCP